MDLLQEGVQRLKEQYGTRWHARIDENLRWISREMDAKPGGVAIQEGIIALSNGLPSLEPPKKPKKRRRRSAPWRVTRRK